MQNPPKREQEESFVATSISSPAQVHCCSILVFTPGPIKSLLDQFWNREYWLETIL